MTEGWLWLGSIRVKPGRLGSPEAPHEKMPWGAPVEPHERRSTVGPATGTFGKVPRLSSPLFFYDAGHAFLRDDPATYHEASAKLAWSRATLFLEKHLAEFREGLTLFWLDAHWWPPVPLRHECEVVAKLDKYVALLDDFSVWEPDFSGDTFFTIAPSSGDAYLNDLSYVSDKLGELYWRPDWEQPKDGKGVGLFLKGVDYDPTPDMKKETLDMFIEQRTRSIRKRSWESGFVVYPLHPSCGKNG